jgi:hypothetical protein
MADLAAILTHALRAHVKGGARPRLPDFARYWWQAFADLHAARQWHAHGPQPITLAEIEAWGRMNRVALAPRHVALLRAMDAVWLDETSKPAPSATKNVSARPLTPELFDAMFSRA